MPNEITPDTDYLHLFQHIPLPTYVWKIVQDKTVLENFNQAALEFSGPKLKRFLGTTVETAFSDVPQIIEDMHQCLSFKAPVTSELKMPLRTTGKSKYLKCTWVWIDPDTLLFHAQDLTGMRNIAARLEQKVTGRTAELKATNERLSQAVDEIQQKKQFLKQVFDSIQEGICVLDTEMNVLKTNKKMEQLYNLEPNYVGGKCYKIFQKDRQGVCDYCPAQKTLKEKVPNKAVVHALRGDDQTDLWTEVFTFPMLDNAGEIIGVIEFVRDITERKQLEEKLKTSEEHLRTLINATPDIVCFKDGQGRWLEANQAALELFALTNVDYRGKTDVELADETDPIYRDAFITCSGSDEKTWQAKTYSRGEEVIQTVQGGEQVFDVIKVPVFEEDGSRKGLVVLGRDITERKQAEAKRLELETQLRQKHKMEAVGYMAGGMAHNFNNDLSIILGNIELLKMKQSISSDVIPLLENAKIAVHRSRDLVKKIITYSRKGLHSKTLTQLSPLIDETLSLLQTTLPPTVRLRQDASPESRSAVIDADPSQIQETLINLCNNAIEAMDGKGDLQIQLATVDIEKSDIPALYEAPPGSYAKIRVQDTGCGMPTEMLDKIFDPFYTTKEEYEGAGMGLATVQGIVAQHGGVIKVNSIPGQGTVFNLYFPIIDSQKLKAVEETNIYLRRLY